MTILKILNKLRHYKASLTRIYNKGCLHLVNSLPKTHKAGGWLAFTNLLWKGCGIKLSGTVYIESGFKCLNPRNLCLDEFVSLGHDNHIWAYCNVSIGKYTQTAKDLLIIAGSHDNDSLFPKDNQQVEIGAGCWIGARVTILGGVKIGKGVIIGACSMVNKDVPDFCVIAGNPARVIKERSPGEMQWNPFKSYYLSEL